MEAFKETTRQLLRADQTQELKEKRQGLENTLSAPPHVLNQVQDVGALRTRLQRTVRMLEEQGPKPYSPDQVDSAVAREKFLRESAAQGMPTQEEMRRNPSGAVDKHRNWESRNKEKILEWKNIRRRLHEGGQIDDLSNAQDVANFERYRPSGGAQQLNMANEQIAGTDYYMVDTPRSVVLDDSEIDLLKQVDPELADSLATASPEVRAAIKDTLAQLNTITVETDLKVTCGAEGAAGPCGRETEGGRCWQHKDKE